jgi:hypothetical protein
LLNFISLYSYYKPALEAGQYGIETTQLIKDPHGTRDLSIWNYVEAKVDQSKFDLNTKEHPVLQQTFQVQAPQFSIDPKTINTYYPPDGHLDDGRILPHIVFNDPHIPWVREAGIGYDFLKGPIDIDGKNKARNLVPWMALLVFDPEELLIPDADAGLTGLKSITEKFSGKIPYNSEKLPGNGAFQMAVADYLALPKSNRINYEAGYQSASAELEQLRNSKEATSVIFPTKSLIKTLLGSMDADPNLAKIADPNTPPKVLFQGQKV